MEQRIINVILRWMWLFVLATLGAGLGAYWYGTQQPTDYEASVRLIVGPGVDGLSPDLNDLRAGAQLMQTYSELATTRPVLQAVVDDVGLEESPERLRRRITVRDNAETQILSIFVRDEDSVRSAAIANALANVLLRLSPSGGESPAALLMNQIRGQAATIEENIGTVEERILQLETDLQAATTAQEQQLYIDQLAQERARLAESRATLALLLESLLNTPTNQVKIVEPAIIGIAVAQSIPLLVLTGSAAGLLLAAVSVLGYEYLDSSIKSVNELEEVAGVTVMGTVVLENEVIYGQPESLIVKEKPKSPSAEEYRRLATKLPLFASANPLRAIVVSGLDDRVDANEIAANLAIVLAQTGSQVLFVDANLTRPTAHSQFQIPATRGGLTELLHSETSSPQLNAVHDVPGLSVLTSGRVSYDAFSDLASPMTGELLDDLKARADVVVIAAPPLSIAASLFLTSHADGVILVAQRGKSSYAQVEDALSNLSAIDVRVVGTVLATRKWSLPTWSRDLRNTAPTGAKRMGKKVGSGLSGTRAGLSKASSAVAGRAERLNLRQRLSLAVDRFRSAAKSVAIGRANSRFSDIDEEETVNTGVTSEPGPYQAQENDPLAPQDGHTLEPFVTSGAQQLDDDDDALEQAAEGDNVDETEETVVTS